MKLTERLAPLASLLNCDSHSIWEGSGNVQCLEMLRAVKKDAGTLEMVLQEIRAAGRGNTHFDSFADRLERELADSTQLEARARRLAELLALALQGSLLVRHAPHEVADAFCASRLAGDAGLAFGTLPADTDFDVIIEAHDRGFNVGTSEQVGEEFALSPRSAAIA